MVTTAPSNPPKLTNKNNQMGYCEINLRIGEAITDQIKPSECPMKLLQDPLVVQQTKEAALSAVLDGYQTIVYNFIRDGTSQLNLLD